MSQYLTRPFPKLMLLIEAMVNLPKLGKGKLIAVAELKKTNLPCRSSST
jgi:hypothetical protein